MSRLLHVIANPKPDDDSVSRQLATHFFRLRHAACPEEALETLDLYIEDVPLLDAVALRVLTEPPANPSQTPNPADRPNSWALSASDRYTAQYLRADRIVITLPMWNFGPPAILKAWVDLIVRLGHTFEFTDDGIRSLAQGKRMLVIGARGGTYSGKSPLRELDFVEPWLRGLFQNLGVEQFEAVWAEGTSAPEAPASRESLLLARQHLEQLAETF